jgi:L-iditol 2-dehydrogenase
MRAIVIDEGGAPRPADVPEPVDGVRVLACGLCGSDVEKLTPAHAGRVLGHEVVAAVDGRRVALVHHAPCGTCDRCRAGHETTCERFAMATIRPGGFAERVSADGWVELPEEVDDARGTMVEPLACVLRGLERVPRGRVLVVGHGFVGRLFAEMLRRRGDDVFAVDTDPRRSGPEPEGPVDAAVLAGAGGAEAAAAAVAPGGTVLVFADAGAIPAEPVYRKELTVVGSRSATPASMAEAARLLPVLDLPDPLVLPLDRFDEGLARFRDRDVLKVVFVP